MRQIAEKRLDEINKLLEGPVINSDSFLKGRLGLLFYYYHLYKVTEKSTLRHKVEGLVEQVFANINSASPGLIGPSLSTGGAGLGYIVDFMHREGFSVLEGNEELENLDKYLFTAASNLIEEDNTDFLYGAFGVIYYFTERREIPSHTHEYLDALIRKICLRIEREEAGCWFKNSLTGIDGKQIINFSLPHGLCGALLVLVNAYERSAEKELLTKVIRDGIRFILKHKGDIDFSRGEYSFFPFTIAPHADEIFTSNRMAWCCGDISEVLLFYRAANLLKDEGLRLQADLIGIQSMMRRDRQSTQVLTSDFYYGAAGVAQVCSTLYKETGLEVYQDSYKFWIEKTILLLEEELDSGAYAGKEHALLEGLIGISLVLLSYVSDTTLNWSRALLL